jgi:outer membrane protein TolC
MPRIPAFPLKTLCYLCGLLLPVLVQAQPQPLSLEEALHRSVAASEDLQAAQAGLARADGNIRIARSQFLPQVNASFAYTRTLQSQFEGLDFGSFGGSADSSNGAGNGDSGFDRLPFGQKNQYNLALTVSQSLYTGGRLKAQQDQARAQHRVAQHQFTEVQAQTLLDVAQRYYDALLSDRLLALADSSLQQAEALLQQTALGYREGSRSEFDLLRAQVSRNNLQPTVLQRRSARDLAYLRLRQAINLPAETPLLLTTPIEEPVAAFMQPADTSADARTSVRQAMENTQVAAYQVRIAASSRKPSISLSSRLAPTAYAGLPTYGDFGTDWTVGISVAMPVYTGKRNQASLQVAQATLEEAGARLQQLREAAWLDARSSHQDLQLAEATWAATRSTVQQAERAYAIARIRYQEGLSTQVELADARLLYEQAVVNQAQASRNLQLARIRLTLLKDLPLNTGGAAPATASGTTVPTPSTPQEASPATTTGEGF